MLSFDNFSVSKLFDKQTTKHIQRIIHTKFVFDNAECVYVNVRTLDGFRLNTFTLLEKI